MRYLVFAFVLCLGCSEHERWVKLKGPGNPVWINVNTITHFHPNQDDHSTIYVHTCDGRCFDVSKSEMDKIIDKPDWDKETSK